MRSSLPGWADSSTGMLASLGVALVLPRATPVTTAMATW